MRCHQSWSLRKYAVCGPREGTTLGRYRTKVKSFIIFTFANQTLRLVGRNFMMILPPVVFVSLKSFFIWPALLKV